MKRFTVGLLFIFTLVSIGAAQSGRKVTPVPTPIVAENQDVGDYSESAPNKPRSIYASPNYSGKKSKSKTKADTKSQSNQTTPVSTATNQTETVDEDVVKVETNLITIPVSVFDRSGLYIPNLRQSDFKIFEDGKEQEIAYFGTSDKPFTVILLIDTSPSTAYKIEEIQNAAIAFTNQLKPQDNVMVVEFDANIHVLTEATNDRQKIHKAIRKADFGDGTSLYDAVDFSLRKRLSKVEGRKAIVLFTDGVDTASYKNDYDSTLLEAEESDALIFPIYYNTYLENRGIGSGGNMGLRGTSSSDYAVGKKYLEDLAADTGGRVFRPEATPGGLTIAFEGIAEELRRQYNIGYYPKEEGQIGQRKQIKVRVNRSNLVVRARDSY
ncbi:MAG TPA: VWA domain-containing protein, partial [Pyrinomonadaceae bacterium]|nr:VWA domain-containing protein [Pyrinomonadaceae bacterium]